MLNKARGNVDKKTGIFRQGSMGQEPGGHTNSLGSGLNTHMTPDKLGPLGNSQPWPSPATQGPTNTTQGLPHSTSPHAGNKGPTNTPDVDLSQLSEEERAIIESVMAKAQEMETHDTPAKRSADEAQRLRLE
ncbi:hypothetical protein C7M84_015787, partial [Penaeus vannamei]